MNGHASLPVAILALSALSACSTSDSARPAIAIEGDASTDGGLRFDPAARGPFVPGAARFEVTQGGRTLPVMIWYPAAESARSEEEIGHDLAELEPPGARRDTLASLVAAAPAGCTTRTAHVALDAAPAERATPWPVLAFSHCHGCLRFSELVVAERLASWGFVVAAPDHVGDTLWEQLEGTIVKIDGDFLKVRGADVRAVLDAVLGGATGVPRGLSGHLDTDRVAMFGHSYGSITTGLVLQDDARVKAGVMMAAPPENPLVPGVTLANLHQPAMFVLAEEDNSIKAIGNQYIQDNFDRYGAPAWLVSVKDAGHWSFSDIAGLTDYQHPGCGTDQRQTDPNVQFAYLDNDVGREVAARYVTGFFMAQLLGDSDARATLGLAVPADVVTVTARSQPAVGSE